MSITLINLFGSGQGQNGRKCRQDKGVHGFDSLSRHQKNKEVATLRVTTFFGLRYLM